MSKLAGRWCSSYQFHEWIRPVYDLLMGGDGSGSGDIDCYPAITIDQFNTHAIYVLCGIESRVELDHDKVAEQKFHTLIRIPYGEWLKKND